MKRSPIFIRLLMLGLVLMLVLVACEKPTPGAEEQEKNAQATQEAVDAGAPEPTAVLPTAAPAVVEQPTVAPIDNGDMITPIPSESPSGTPDGDTAPAIDPTTVPDSGAIDPTPDPNVGGNNPTTAITPVPAGGTYTVSAGENFFRIGLNHGCTVEQMAAVNPAVVPPSYIIYIGQELTIPNCQ